MIRLLWNSDKICETLPYLVMQNLLRVQNKYLHTTILFIVSII